MKEKEVFRDAFLVVTFAITAFFTAHNTDYIAYTARAVVLPLFFISVLEFLNRIKEETIRALEKEQINHNHTLTMWEPYYNLAKKKCLSDEMDELSEKCISDYKSEEVNFVYTVEVIIEVKRLYKWYFPSIVIAIAFLLFGIIFAHEENVMSFFSYINGDVITLWTLVFFLLNLLSVDFFSGKLRKVAEKKVDKEKIADVLNEKTDN